MNSVHEMQATYSYLTTNSIYIVKCSNEDIVLYLASVGSISTLSKTVKLILFFDRLCKTDAIGERLRSYKKQL